ncbi:MOSC domain-containing protein [Tundrisphaera lichenicola]|uniref:MOSC domain-containing protein n=1 Tax=Tundrisphaera lichenicola TaxID=2029860 RepID=UPI003EB6CA50
MSMRVDSVNVGMPKTRIWQGRYVSTAIFKEPVSSKVPLRGFNLEGDAQADLTVHGGRDKAVYAYPREHYAFWRGELPDRDLTPGNFGENLTTEGLLEDEVSIGDEFRVGTAKLVVTQPRQPCFKLGMRFNDPLMVRRFRLAGRPGIYFAVVEEGEVGPGDPIECTRREQDRVTVVEVAELIYDRHADPEALRKALKIRALAAVIREDFEGRIE